MKIGVILARMQPIHKGHLELIRQALNENERVLILVGSANKINKRNPIPIKLRTSLIRKSIENEFEDSLRVQVVPLDDLTDENDNSHDWGFYLYCNIVEQINQPFFTIYYSDGYETIMSWFPTFVTRDFISFKLNARGTVYNGLSATHIRELILNDQEELKDLVPECVYEQRTLLKNFIEAFNSIN